MTFGLEWGYVASLHTAIHYNFFAPEGYRVSDRRKAFGYLSNADMYAHIGYNLTPQWNLSMYVGYEAVAHFGKAVPVSLRMTRYFNADPESDRWFTFVDLGSGICIKQPVQEILTGKVGGGYRLSLGGSAALDFLISARTTYTHPLIIYDKTLIPANRINRNNALVSALSVGMSLTF